MNLSTVEPCTVVIFGALGDLAKRKLLPALYNLAAGHVLPDQLRVIGVGRKPMDHDAYRAHVREGLEEFNDAPDPALWEWFASRLFHAFSTLEDAQSYQSLKEQLTQPGGAPSPSNFVFYLAVPPAAVAGIVAGLGAADLLKESPGVWRRVIIEKPFGHDLASARALNEELLKHLAEHQIYRIDHYLGKETVQNIMAFRFANGIFEPIWNRRYVDHVQITLAETVGVENRGAFYEEAGAMRDVVQNHMFQLVALTAMEPPISFEPNAVRDERVKVLHAIHDWSPEEVMQNTVRGQYVAGESGGKKMPGYREEPNVAPWSTTETYIAMKLFVENWRWADVPFYLRTGKRLPKRVTEIAVRFRSAPLRLFRDKDVKDLEPNLLVMRIQPGEGISLRLQAKIPGDKFRLGAVNMDFDYADYFASTPNTGYETLLYDCMTGDPTLFHRADMVEAGWAVVEPLLNVLKKSPWALLHNYTAFSAGPDAADALLAKDGRKWRELAGTEPSSSDLS